MTPQRWGRKYPDALLALGVCVGLLVEMGSLGYLTDKPLAALVAVLAAAPLAARRSYPLGSFVVTWSVLIPAAAYGLAPGMSDLVVFLVLFFVSLYSLGAYARGTPAWVGGCLVLVGVGIFVANDGDTFAPGDVIFGTAVVAGPWAAGLAIRLRRDNEGSLLAHAEDLEKERDTLARAAVAEERSRIARELHDVVSHALSVTVLQARGGRRFIDDDPAAVREAFDAIELSNAQALDDMRRMLGLLRHDDDEPHEPRSPQPSLNSLDNLVLGVRSAGCAVEVHRSGDAQRVPPSVQLSAFRIAQEALTNVVKHSEAPAASLSVECGDTALAVVVADAGPARDAQTVTSGGHGLLGIRERVSVAGGTLDVGPTPQGGFRVAAVLPYGLDPRTEVRA